MSTRSIVLYIATTLDGYIARENGEIDWLGEVNETEDYGYAAFYGTVDTVVMGKATYDQILTFDVDFPYTDKACYVLSHSEKEENGHVQFVCEKVAPFIERLKKGRGANIWLVGGAELIASFAKVEGIDEYVITIMPLILGNGIPLFRKGIPETQLTLKEVSRFGDVAQLHYVKV